MSKVVQRLNSGEINGLQDCKPPIGSYLSGKYVRSFAFTTIKDRLPVILTQIIDSLSRHKEEIAKIYTAEAIHESKQITGAISRLKNELVTNKPIVPLCPIPDRIHDDTAIWNEKITKLSELFNEEQTWYNTIWLFCECYMYRRIANEFLLTNLLKNYDPFRIRKEESFFNSIGSISHLSGHIMELINTKNYSRLEHQENVINLLKLSLWGNRCDLSLSCGSISLQDHNPLHVLESLDKEILVNNSKDVWNLLNTNTQTGSNIPIIDIVLDNAGYELFTDICLALFLTEKKFVKKIRFYVKQYPWFVSDVTEPDFHWLIETMSKSDNQNIQSFGEICKKYLKDNVWIIEIESFWTQPYDFSEMKTVDPVLYSKLSEALLIIFKGDLNYRKLLGDINWKYTTNFHKALREFEPTNLVSLRTLKADLCVGLLDGTADLLESEYPDWMITGRFGLIQASIK